MKKTVITALMLVSITAFAQFKPRAAFDCFPGGYKTNLTYAGASSCNIMNYGTYRTRIGFDYAYKRATVRFDQYVYMKPYKLPIFQPLQAEWYIGAKFDVYKGVSLSVQHLCIHPVISYNSLKTQSLLHGGYNMISISYGY